MRFCDCTECRQLLTNDPVSGALLRGQYVGDFVYKQHRSRDLAQIRANTQLEHLDPGLPSHDQTTFPSIPSPESSSTAHRYTPLPEDGIQTTQTSTTDVLQDRLHTIYKKIANIDIKQLFESTKLVFRSPPSPFSRPMVVPCADQLALADNIPTNKAVVELERWLESAHDLIEVILARSDLGGEAAGCHELSGMVLSRVEHDQGAMLAMKHAQWEKIRRDSFSMSNQCKRVETSSSDYFTPASAFELPLDHRVARPFLHVDPRLLLSYLLVAFLHLIAGLSLKHCRIVLVSLRGLLSLGQPNTDHGPPIHSQLPRDVETAIARLDLSPQTRAYVCCAKCFALYAYNPEEPGAFPEVCSSTRTSSSVACGALLSSHPRPGIKARSSSKPIRLYLYNELHDFVGSMYCRGDIETSLDRDLGTETPPGDGIDDILNSPGLTNFLGPEGDPNRPFLRRPGNEGRLVFSLNMDGFNPFMNKESGKKVSVGAIYMVCLSLPPAIRYDIENMYLVAIIPGPKEPSKDEINHLIEPLVDDLLVIWYHGFFLLSTCNHPHGRLVRAAVIALVCDLLAAKQMGGFAGIASHHFCSHCTLDLDDIDDFNCLLWPRRTAQEHRVLAEEWKAAPTEAERDAVFQRTGIRWSQLLRLPYWDPTKFVTIDSMHGFSLRMFQRHCRQIWGMNTEIVDGDYPSFAQEKGRPSEEAMEKAMDILRYGREEKLRGLKRDVLRELARATESVPYAGRVKKLVSGLLKYRIEKGWFDQNGEVTSTDLDLIGGPRTVPPAGPQRRDRPATTAEIEHGRKVVQSGTKSAIQKIRKPVLLGVCQQLDIEADSSLLVPEIRQKIEDWRFQEGIIDEDGTVLVVKRGKKSVVLGKDTLKEVRMDMSHLELPSWVSRAPGRPGEAKTGKFTADQWKTFCQVNLTVTLNRLWGQEDEGSRKRLMLENFMHLVTAIKLGTMRRMTRQRIDAYIFHIQQYLTNLIALYPGTTISPYQHLALHFQEFLERFGPVHAWRCFPFERYNYLLQQIPTNMKFGEMESTLLNTFCKGQKLHSLVDPGENQLPATLHDILSEWQNNMDNDLRGSRINDTLSMDDTFDIKDDVDVLIKMTKKESLPRFWLLLLRDHLRTERGGTDSPLSQFGYQKKRLRRRGETFQNRESSACDSNIFYQSPGGAQAGSIEGMFIHDCGGTENHLFLVIKPYQPIPKELECYDPYRRFPEAAGQLYRDSLGAEILIHAKDLLYHFAKAPVEIRQIPFSCIVTLPLDR